MGQTEGLDFAGGQLVFILFFYLLLSLQERVLVAQGTWRMEHVRPPKQTPTSLYPSPHPRQLDLPCVSKSLDQAGKMGCVHFLSKLGRLDG